MMISFVCNDYGIHKCGHILQCFLTGVKGFQYKDKTTYDLHVYVDDGSLISEILIDHKVSACYTFTCDAWS